MFASVFGSVGAVRVESMPLKLRLDVDGNGIPSVATGLGSGAFESVGRSAELSGAPSWAEAPNDGGGFIDGAVYEGFTAGPTDVLVKFAGKGLFPSG